MASEDFHLSDVVRQRGELMSADVHDEKVLLDVQSGACFGFNAVGSRIWALVEAPQSVAAICQTLLDEFEIDAESCRTEVLAFLRTLRDEGLVEIVKPQG